MKGELREIALELCTLDPEFNTRRTLGDLTELTESIKVDGILQPLVGREMDSGKIVVCAGFRRFAAAQKADLKKIPIIVYSRRQMNGKQMLTANIVENIHRENLNPVDEAFALKRLQEDHKMSTDEICASLGVKKSRVQQRFKILKLEEPVLEALHSERITVFAALEIDRLPVSKQDKFLRAAENFSGQKLKELIDKELNKLQGDLPGTESEPEVEKPPTDPAMTTENIRLIKQCTSVICSGLGYDDNEKAAVKAVDYRPLDQDDLTRVAKFLNDLASQVEDDIDFNEKAEAEIVSIVEKGTSILRLDTPVVRQSLIRSMAQRAKELAVEKSQETKKRAKVTFAIAKDVIEEFFEEDAN